jgi:hypothetical protein
VIGLIERGVQSYTCCGVRHVTPVGALFLVQSEEAHTGEAVSADGYVYRTAYPSAELLAQANAERCGKTEVLPFRQDVIHDRSVSKKFLRLHRAVTGQESALACEAMFLEALGELIYRYGHGSFEGGRFWPGVLCRSPCAGIPGGSLRSRSVLVRSRSSDESKRDAHRPSFHARRRVAAACVHLTNAY